MCMKSNYLFLLVKKKARGKQSVRTSLVHQLHRCAQLPWHASMYCSGGCKEAQCNQRSLCRNCLEQSRCGGCKHGQCGRSCCCCAVAFTTAVVACGAFVEAQARDGSRSSIKSRSQTGAALAVLKGIEERTDRSVCPVRQFGVNSTILDERLKRKKKKTGHRCGISCWCTEVGEQRAVAERAETGREEKEKWHEEGRERKRERETDRQTDRENRCARARERERRDHNSRNYFFCARKEVITCKLTKPELMQTGIMRHLYVCSSGLASTSIPVSNA